MGRMKVYMKMMFLIVGMLIMSDSVFAQRPQSSMGIRGGTNFASPAGERDIFGGNNLEGYHLGFYATLNFTEFFALQPEFLFSRRSFVGPRGQYVYPGTEESFPFYMESYDYMDIPVLFRFNVAGGFHFLAGPQLSNQLGSKDRYIDFGGREFIQRYAGGNFVDLSGVVGIAYEFAQGLNIGVRYGYGLGRIHSIRNFEGGNVPHQTQGMFTIGHTFGGRVFREPSRDLYFDE
ncbi:MAG: porin family protein [Cytophagaceae bacterium]